MYFIQTEKYITVNQNIRARWNRAQIAIVIGKPTQVTIQSIMLIESGMCGTLSLTLKFSVTFVL